MKITLKDILQCLIVIVIGIVMGGFIHALWFDKENNNNPDVNTESISDSRILVDDSLESAGDAIDISIERSGIIREQADRINILESEIAGLNRELADYNQQSESIVVESAAIIIESGKLGADIGDGIGRAREAINYSLEINRRLKEYAAGREGQD